MKKKSFLGVFGLTALTLSALITSCTSDPNSAGLEYMPDMYRSPAIESYVDYGEVRGRIDESKKSRLTAMTPPKYTIPFYGADSAEVKLMLPYMRLANASFKTTHGLYDSDLSTLDEYALAINDKNPFLLTSQNAESVLNSGKALYVSMCQHCHGEKGDGNGKMVTNGFYSGVPNYADRAALSDGQLFYSIYYGKGMMGGHGSLLSKKEIWTLVHFIRQVQNPEYGKFDTKGNAVSVSTDTITVKMK